MLALSLRACLEATERTVLSRQCINFKKWLLVRSFKILSAAVTVVIFLLSLG